MRPVLVPMIAEEVAPEDLREADRGISKEVLFTRMRRG
jgi:hypothetical protein